jgi:chaperonin GroEL (HSP60 family)
VLVFEKKISALPQLLPLLEAIVKTNRPLLIVAEDIEGNVHSTISLFYFHISQIHCDLSVYCSNPL